MESFHAGRGIGRTGCASLSARIGFWSALCWILVVSSLRAFETDPARIDLSPALTIGDITTSRYVVDKNYNLFAAGHPGSKPDETAIWFRHFIAQSYIKSLLSAQGWENRPEVSLRVDRMTRYILTRPEGPYYQSLDQSAGPAPAPNPELKEATRQIFDALLVRFGNAADAASLRGREPSGFEGRLRSFVLQHPASEIDFHDGEIIWPYHPFEEIDSDLRTAAVGTWSGPLTRDSGVYFILVRGKRTGALQPVVESETEFRRYLSDLRKLRVMRAHRSAVLHAAGFAIDEATFAQIYSKMIATHLRTLDDSLADEKIASYQSGGIRQPISVRQVRDHVQDQVMRREPQDAAGLRECVEDVVIENADLQAALALGFAATPKFQQDRQNFAWNQILALYETSELRPRLHLDRETLRAYFTQNKEQFRTAIEAIGTIYLYDTLAQAAEARSSTPRNEMSLGRGAQKVISLWTIHRGDRDLFDNVPNSVLLGLKDGEWCGPFPFSGKSGIFVKHSGKEDVPAFESIETRVAAVAERAQLDELELREFMQRPAAPRVTIALDFSDYGIVDPFDPRPGVKTSAAQPFSSGDLVRPIATTAIGAR